MCGLQVAALSCLTVAGSWHVWLNAAIFPPKDYVDLLWTTLAEFPGKEKHLTVTFWMCCIVLWCSSDSLTILYNYIACTFSCIVLYWMYFYGATLYNISMCFTSIVKASKRGLLCSHCTHCCLCRFIHHVFHHWVAGPQEDDGFRVSHVLHLCSAG